jgi:hypothetical protein
MVSADMGLTLDDVKAGTPYPFFVQSLRERVRVNARPVCRVHQHGMSQTRSGTFPVLSIFLSKRSKIKSRVLRVQILRDSVQYMGSCPFEAFEGGGMSQRKRRRVVRVTAPRKGRKGECFFREN